MGHNETEFTSFGTQPAASVSSTIQFESIRKGVSMDLRRARDGGKILPQPEARQNCRSRIELISSGYTSGSGARSPCRFFSVRSAKNDLIRGSSRMKFRPFMAGALRLAAGSGLEKNGR